VQNLSQQHLLNKSAFFSGQTGANRRKQVAMSPALARNGKESGAEATKKEYELSNLLRIKSNKLGSSAPNLCSSMVSGRLFYLRKFSEGFG